MERERSLHPCTSCDMNSDAPLLSWRQGVHRAWCPTYGLTLLGIFVAFLVLAVVGALAPKNGRYFDWRLFAFLLNAIVVMLLVHVRARRARARSDGIER